MYKSIILINILCIVITLYLYITNKINKNINDKSYYIKLYLGIMLYSIIFINIDAYIKNFDINVQEILTGSPEF